MEKQIAERRKKEKEKQILEKEKKREKEKRLQVGFPHACFEFLFKHFITCLLNLYFSIFLNASQYWSIFSTPSNISGAVL